METKKQKDNRKWMSGRPLTELGKRSLQYEIDETAANSYSIF